MYVQAVHGSMEAWIGCVIVYPGRDGTVMYVCGPGWGGLGGIKRG